MEKTICEKITDQKIEETAERIDRLPPELKARAIGYIDGFNAGVMFAAEEKRAG